jgi:tetratricopeptide (TPR) repeat protein
VEYWNNGKLGFILKAACICLAIFLSGPSEGLGFRNLKEGEHAPDFKLKDLDGNVYSLSGLKGKVVLILYWRVGQERSVKALKELKILSENFIDQPLQILAITKDTEEKSQIKDIRKSLALPFPVLLDVKAKIYTDFGVFVFPSTALIDKKGVYQYHYGGFRDGYKSELSQQIRLMLGLITKEELEKEKQQKSSGQTDAQRKAIHHIRLGKKLEDKGLYEKALQEFEKAAEMDPGNPEAHVELGFSLLEQKEVDRALQHFQKAAKLNPLSADAKIGLGSAYRMQGKTDKALEILKTGLKLCPDSALVHFELGKIYESLGNANEALKHYKQAAECALRLRRRRKL